MEHRYFNDTFCTVTRPDKPSSSVVILPDFPDTKTYRTMMHWLNRRGHTTFYPRYKGSMQSHGGFLNDHPGEEMSSFIKDIPSDDVVVLGVGFGSLVALSAATRVEIDGVILCDPWWDVDLLSEPETYFEAAFKHHHYLYRDERDNLPKSLRHFEDMYPFGYAESVSSPVLCFLSSNPPVPKEAAEEMQSFLDIRLVDHNAVSVEQCFVQNIDRVYSFLNEVTL